MRGRGRLCVGPCTGAQEGVRITIRVISTAVLAGITVMSMAITAATPTVNRRETD